MWSEEHHLRIGQARRSVIGEKSQLYWPLWCALHVDGLVPWKQRGDAVLGFTRGGNGLGTISSSDHNLDEQHLLLWSVTVRMLGAGAG